MAVMDESQQPENQHGQGRNFNDIGTDEYLRDTGEIYPEPGLGKHDGSPERRGFGALWRAAAPYGPLSDEEFELRELMRYRDFLSDNARP